MFHIVLSKVFQVLVFFPGDVKISLADLKCFEPEKITNVQNLNNMRI